MADKERTIRIGNQELPVGAAGQTKRRLYNKKTGESRDVYNVDAREYLRQGDWVPSRQLVDAELRKKAVAKESKADAESRKQEDKTDNDGVPNADGNTAKWDDWSDYQLRTKAESLNVAEADQMGRPELVETLNGLGLQPSDDKPQDAAEVEGGSGDGEDAESGNGGKKKGKSKK